MMKDTVVRTVIDAMFGNIQNRPTWTRNITTKVHLRVIASETHAQKMRPAALPILTIPTIPAATITLAFAISWNIGDSCEISEMPAEVFRNSSNHSAHHCQVFSASPSV